MTSFRLKDCFYLPCEYTRNLHSHTLHNKTLGYGRTLLPWNDSFPDTNTKRASFTNPECFSNTLHNPSNNRLIWWTLDSSNHQIIKSIIPIATEGDMKLPVNTNNGEGWTDSYPLNNLSRRMRVYSIDQYTHTVLSSINTSLNIITISLSSSSLIKYFSFYTSSLHNSLTSLPRNTPKYSTSFSISILTERFSAGGWLRD